MIKKYPVDGRSRKGVVKITHNDCQKVFKMHSLEPSDIAIVSGVPGRVLRKDEQSVSIDIPSEVEVQEFQKIIDVFEKISDALEEEKIDPAMVSLFLGIFS